MQMRNLHVEPSPKCPGGVRGRLVEDLKGPTNPYDHRWQWDEDTQPIPVIPLPTVRELREECGMQYFEVALAARVRPRVAYWMEQGVGVYQEEALRILDVFSRYSGKRYTLATVRGVRLKKDRYRYGR